MEIRTVMGTRVFLTEMAPYKQPSSSNLDIIQYKGVIMKAKVAHVGVHCKHVKEGDEVIYEAPVGMDLGFEGKKYLVIPEQDIIFVV